MKNILHVVHYPQFGGPHNQALRLDTPLRQRGWNTIVLTSDEPGNAVERLRTGGVDTMTMPLRRLRASPNLMKQARYGAGFGADVLRIRRIIRDRKIDVVVVAGLVNPQAAIAARLEGIAVVWQIVDTRAPMLMRRALVPLVTKLSGSVMTTGNLTASAHPGLATLGDRLIPFFPPVDCDAFTPAPYLKPLVRLEWGINSEKRPVIGSVGNINPQKGIENLIAATKLLHSGGTRARLALVGAEYGTHQTYSAHLRNQIAESGLREGDDVLFLGSRSDVSRQLQAIDLFVMGSVPRSEGIPTAILEAAACGVPVVATDVGGIKETIIQGQTGIVVPPQDSRALAHAIESILGDEKKLANMGDAARRYAVQTFDINVCAETHIRAFETAIKHQGTFCKESSLAIAS